MRCFQILKSCLKKRRVSPVAFLSSFRFRPIITWKVNLQQWLRPKQPWVCFKKTKTAGLLKNEINNFVGLHFHSPTHPQTRVQPRFCLRRGFCLKNASMEWRTEQSGATQSSHTDGGLRAKPLSLGNCLRKKTIVFQRHLDHLSPFGYFARFWSYLKELNC